MVMDNDIFKIPDEFVCRNYDDGNAGISDYRSTFMRDRDRILYCTAFRRLSGKTQIYTIGSDDHKRNRMTHSLEVAQIARTISQALGLNCDLTEAIALAHDLGHTPFGHAGEAMLNQIMFPNENVLKGTPFFKKSEADINNNIRAEKINNPYIDKDCLFGFKHNIQSVRVVAKLEDSYRNNNGDNIGLNLTNYSLWGIMNHSNLFFKDGDYQPNYQNRFANMMKVKGLNGEAWSFEGYVVKLADDIAQWHHDLEDAIRGKAVPLEIIYSTIIKSLKNALSDSDIQVLNDEKNRSLTDRRCMAVLSHIVINTLITDLVENSKKNLEELKKALKNVYPESSEKQIAKKLYGKYDEQKTGIKKDSIIAFSENIHEEEFKRTINKSVHYSKEVIRMNEKGCYIIRKLFEAYYAHPQQLPDGPIVHFMVEAGKYENIDEAKKEGSGLIRTEFNEIMKNPSLILQCLLMRRICDHIASMTDRYAIEEYHSLY